MQSGQPTFYVVDDDESVRVSLCRLLQSASMNAKSFASAQDFLDFLEEETGARQLAAGDCAIIDVHMPNITGFELMIRLQTSHPKLRVVLITASMDPRAATIAAEAGVVLLRKPFDDSALMLAIAPQTVISPVKPNTT